MQIKQLSLAAGILSLSAVQPVSAHEALTDAGLYSIYGISKHGASFTVCGTLGDTDGCYGSASLGKFDFACGLLEGKSTQEGNVITRAIYVLDKRTALDASANLYVFKRTDTLTDTTDTIRVKRQQVVDLGFLGGSPSICSLAANDRFVYAGTDADVIVTAVNKSDFSTRYFNSGSPPEHVFSITADDRGYIALRFEDSYNIIKPSGEGDGEGGGSATFVNTENGYIPVKIPR